MKGEAGLLFSFQARYRLVLSYSFYEKEPKRGKKKKGKQCDLPQYRRKRRQDLKE